MLHHPGVVSRATLNPTLSLVSEWLRLLPFLGVLALLGYLAVRPFLPKKKQQKDSLINLKIQKENPKVVNEINIEDLCLTKAYCRCWRSKTVRHCATVGLEIETCIFLSVLWCGLLSVELVLLSGGGTCSWILWNGTDLSTCRKQL